MAWNLITDAMVDAESPLTESLAKGWRDNPEAVAAGDGSVPSGKRILVPEALRTANNTITDFLTPDGAGGTQWTPRSSIAGSLVWAGTNARVLQLNGFLGPTSILLETLPIAPTRLYQLSTTVIVEYLAVPYEIRSSAVQVSGGAFVSLFPWNLVLPNGITISLAIVAGNLEMSASVTPGLPNTNHVLTFTRTEMVGVRL